MGLYPDVRKQEGEQEAVSTMQKAISVEQVSAMGAQAAAFRIAYKGRDPAKTAQVTNQIAAMFIEENLKVREEQSYGTADFLEGELQKTAQQVQEKANELAEVRSHYGQDLPDAGLHAQEAEALRQQLHTAEQQITQDQQQKVDLQSLEASTAPTVDVDLYAGNSPNESEPEALQTQLNALRSRYGPNHPDVRKLQAQLDRGQGKGSRNARSEDSDACRTQAQQPGDRSRIGTTGSGYRKTEEAGGATSSRDQLPSCEDAERACLSAKDRLRSARLRRSAGPV